VTTVVVSVPKVVDRPNVGGHFWVYMQYVHGLRRLGCDVWWMERVRVGANRDEPNEPRLLERVRLFQRRMHVFGMAGRVLLYSEDGPASDGSRSWSPLTLTRQEAETVCRKADLLLSFDYTISPEVAGQFNRTALVDIDPGLLQFWMYHGQLSVTPHDIYFTTGETVGSPTARFPDCGLDWHGINPGVSLDLWPWVDADSSGSFTTVSSWWSDEWISDGTGHYENNKRVSFLSFTELPRLTGESFELALCLGPGDADDIARLTAAGWKVRHSAEVSGSPQSYQRYLQTSKSEFSCAKPSCMNFQNAWISDRTLCFLASGRPAIVQNTGPSRRLPSGDGLFRFDDIEEAVASVAAVNADYSRNRRAARELVEAYFDVIPALTDVLDTTLRSDGRVHAHPTTGTEAVLSQRTC